MRWSNNRWVRLFGYPAIVIIAMAVMILTAPAGETANIYQDGRLIETVDLSKVAEPYTFTVTCENGSNVIAVEPGRISVQSADCHDLACVGRGWIYERGASPVVCLPHGLVISLGPGEDSGIDATAG